MTAPLIALTGATGFIGHHLLKELPKRGYRIRVLLRRPADVPEGASSAVIGDIAAPQNMAAALRDADAMGWGTTPVRGPVSESTSAGGAWFAVPAAAGGLRAGAQGHQANIATTATATATTKPMRNPVFMSAPRERRHDEPK